MPWCPILSSVKGWGMRGRAILPSLLELGPAELKINLTEPASPRFTVLPLKRTNLAMIFVWHSQADGAKQRQSDMAGMRWQLNCFQVTESTPVACGKEWEGGESSLGTAMLTAMKKRTLA
jgi:hypothetical protein